MKQLLFNEMLQYAFRFHTELLLFFKLNVLYKTLKYFLSSGRALYIVLVIELN